MAMFAGVANSALKSQSGPPAGPVSQSNGGNSFDFSGWTAVTGKNNSAAPKLDWKIAALIGLGALLIWKTSRKN